MENSSFHNSSNQMSGAASLESSTHLESTTVKLVPKELILTINGSQGYSGYGGKSCVSSCYR